MKKYLLCIFAISLMGTAAAEPELRGSPQELTNYLLEQRRLVTLSASAREEVEADTAIVAIQVKTKESKLNDALQANEKLRTTIRERLQQVGIPADAIKASKFSSSPNYSWFREKPSSYEVTNEVKISITNEARLRAIAKLVDEEAEIAMGAMEFKDSKKEAHERMVLQKALADLQGKKQVYEESLGLQLTPVRVIEQRVYALAPRPMAQKRLSAPREESLSSIMGSDMAVEMPASDFGAITYTADAVVEFVTK